ncbi:uncharacterized protein A4U43_C04F13820 [Asparagus officinalis]|uniref:Alkyl transferase n=1 Tax=Asparagus officinalis TaxID=4686 RepID=A0A5P1F0P6_ASPOF|nr:dehydrodolichyl diphosphate synthase 6-like [Asparagus officinalis]ONK71925.1 uncharacterized protein A4U43_C04F13820 [Asparagus officinalis]
MDAKTSTTLIPTTLLDGVRSSLRRLLFQVLSVGPMPHHVSFYGFSIDNFKRRPTEVQILMGLIRDKAEAMSHNSGIVDELGVRVEFLGKLDTLDEPTREAIQGVMDATAKNTKMVLLICLAYTSTDEIVHGVKGAVTEKIDGDASISVEDLEKNMYYAGCPDPDILVRTSGETRLSNFLLWQTTHCLLYCPRCLWPEISLRHLVWGVVQYQRNYQYLEKIKKKM